MRTRTVLEIALVWTLVAAFLVGYIGAAGVHEAAPSATVPTLAGSPTHFGHPLIPVGAGQLSPSQTPSLSCPLTASQCWASYNWGGYADYATSFVVTKVTGSWTVPTIAGSNSATCPDVQHTWDSNAQWIGIDGAFTPTVEQTGTSADCFYGQTSYYAWYEFYPSGSVVTPLVVSPGDHISATVSFTGLNATGVPTFQTSLSDTTAGWTFTSPVTPVPGALMESAEWIDESPYYYGFLGLTHVTPVTFSAGSATINGQKHPIGDWGTSNVYWFVSVDYNFPYDETINFVKGEPLALAPAKAGFQFDWVSDGP